MVARVFLVLKCKYGNDINMCIELKLMSGYDDSTSTFSSSHLHAPLEALLDTVALSLKSTNKQAPQFESRQFVSDLC